MTRVIQLLPRPEQVRLLNGYEAHKKAPYYASIQRRGRFICLAREGSDIVEVYDFGLELNAQRCLSALTDCLRTNRAPIKVLMPAPPPKD